MNDSQPSTSRGLHLRGQSLTDSISLVKKRKHLDTSADNYSVLDPYVSSDEENLDDDDDYLPRETSSDIHSALDSNMSSNEVNNEDDGNYMPHEALLAIPSALDSYVSSDEENIDDDGDYLPHDISSSSDSEWEEEVVPRGRSVPTPSAPLPSPYMSPTSPSSQSSPHVAANAPCCPPPPVGIPDPTKFTLTEGDRYVPNNHVFDATSVGFSQKVTDLGADASILEYFELLFDDQLMDIIVSETNNFFEFSGRTDSAVPFSPSRRWKDTNTTEMYVFLALTLLMTKVTQDNIRDHWDEHSLTYIAVFGKYMSCDRYQLLMRYLHFSDNANVDQNDSMYKIRRVFDNLTTKFKDIYKPYQKDINDEPLVLFRGRTAFRQYIKTKYHSFGLKVFVMCDCQTDIILDMILYTGRTTDIPKKYPLGVSGAVVRQMIHSYVGEGQVMYMDNLDTSPSLWHYLHEQNVGSCGTVCENRKYKPKLFTKKKKGACVKQKCSNILAVKWIDRSSVTVLASVHKREMLDSNKKDRSGEVLMKPDAILDYNVMRLVDESDTMIGKVDCIQKTVKWYKKLFFHLVDVSIQNIYLYYKIQTKKYIPMSVFVDDMIIQILEKYGTVAKVSQGCAEASQDLPDHLAYRDYVARHHLVSIPLPTNLQRKQRASAQRLCKVCSKTTQRARKNKRTSMMCKECQAPLCLNCFVDYHTIEDY